MISEPDRGQRRWIGKEEGQRVVYANRRRIKIEHRRALMQQRGEYVERSFAHVCETGGTRRTWLRTHAKILKRYLMHVADFNLGLVMRKLVGAGTPRGFAGRLAASAAALAAQITLTLAWILAQCGSLDVARTAQSRSDRNVVAA